MLTPREGSQLHRAIETMRHQPATCLEYRDTWIRRK